VLRACERVVFCDVMEPETPRARMIERYSVACVLCTCLSAVLFLLLWRIVRSGLFCDHTDAGTASCQLLSIYFLIKMALYGMTIFALALFLGALVFVVYYRVSAWRAEVAYAAVAQVV
jgi:hypothetical protein